MSAYTGWFKQTERFIYMQPTTPIVIPCTKGTNTPTKVHIVTPLRVYVQYVRGIYSNTLKHMCTLTSTNALKKRKKKIKTRSWVHIVPIP